MPPPQRNPEPDTPTGALIDQLERAELIELLLGAADRHDDVERAVRLVVARRSGDLTELRTAVDRDLRTRRFLGYHESIEWARSTAPIVTELDTVAVAAPSQELVELLQRAVGHVVKVLQTRADDSSGLIGSVTQDLLAIHAQACDAGVADPLKLAKWMVRFRFRDQDFFEADPVRYAGALGERGLAAYRKAVVQAGNADSFAARYAQQRLAVVDRDIGRIVELLGGDLTMGHQFQAIAEAMIEIDRADLALSWATRGIEETAGWQTDRLYTLACRLHTEAGAPTEALRLRRAHHERTPSTSTYSALRTAAGACDAWHLERDAARSVLERTDLRGFVSALLDDGDDEQAWEAAGRATGGEIDLDLRLRLAKQRAITDPADALAVYIGAVDEILVVTDRRAYQRAVRILKEARTAAEGAGRTDAFAAEINRLRETHRRRPTFIATLERAKLTEDH